MIPDGEAEHEGVYMIDASSDSPEMVKSCELNFKTRNPIVCTIGAKIYVLPASLYGHKFECFDPESNSCTVLPSPQDAMEAHEESSEFNKLEIENLSYSRNSSHAVVGSNLVVSLSGGGGVFRFDTTRPDRGWRKILLVLENDSTPHLLNFLPFDRICSFPIRDDLILSSPRVHNYDRAIDPHIRRSFKLNINTEDSYVCSFHNVAQLSDPKCEFVKVSIHPVIGLPKLKSDNDAFYESDDGSEDEVEVVEFVNNCRTIGDGIVLVSKDGRDEYGFEIFQVGKAPNSDKDHHYESTKISSVRFKTRDIFTSMTPFLIKG